MKRRNFFGAALAAVAGVFVGKKTRAVPEPGKANIGEYLYSRPCCEECIFVALPKKPEEPYFKYVCGYACSSVHVAFGTPPKECPTRCTPKSSS
jgi:hypothetical protein